MELNTVYKDLKNCFEIVVSEDENESSDEEEMSDLKGGDIDIENSLLPPPTAVDFPVAPSSPEISESTRLFHFLERVCTKVLFEVFHISFRHRILMKIFFVRIVRN